MRKRGKGEENTDSSSKGSDQKSTSASKHEKQDNIGFYIKVLMSISAISFVIVISILAYFYVPYLLSTMAEEDPLWDPANDPEASVEPMKPYVPEEDHGPEYIPYPWVIGPIPRVEWEPDKAFAEIVADLEKPIILTNTFVKNWKAMQHWNPEYIMKHTPRMERVQRHDNKTFNYFHEDHPMSELPGILEGYKQTTYDILNMTSSEFFEVIKKTPPYHYFSSQADTLGEAYNDLYPLEPLIVKNESFKIEESHLNRWTVVWIGPAGASTHTHYDIIHNFYVQIYGKKRFVIFPPEEYNKMYLFPFLHPGAQQSQVRFEAPNYKNFPNFKYIRGYDVVLHPGDVMYLPPLWFHHVSALTTSISVSVWTKFNETQSMYKTVRSPLPFKKTWPPRKLQLAGRLYLEKLITRIYGEGSPQPFVGEVFEQRYLQLYKDFPILFQSELGFCKKDIPVDFEAELLSESGEDFETFLQDHVQLFKSAKNEARRNIWLGNFCEQLALTVVGVRHVGRFLLDFSSC